MSFTFSFGTPATPSDVVSTEEVKVEDASATGATGAALEEDFVDDSRLKLPSGVVLHAVAPSAHEQEEKEVYSVRCKLFRLAPDVEGEVGWRERCIGTLRVFKHDGTGIIRNVMRQDHTKKVFMNHRVSPSASMSVHSSSDKTLLYKAVDFADNELKAETFLMRFKNAEVASAFKDEFVTFQKAMENVSGGAASSGAGAGAAAGAGAGAGAGAAAGAAAGAGASADADASSDPFTHSAPESTNKLTEAEAKARFDVVSQPQYDLHLDLTDGDTYDGKLTATFTVVAKVPEEGVFLDFSGHKIKTLTVNGAAVAADSGSFTWANHRLTLAASLIKAGEGNTVTVEYTNKYDHSGAGFHTFTDPEDNAVYCYTNFEPFDAHRMLPCFDQPDLKAALRFSATAPAAWHVAGNAPMTSCTPIDGDRKKWEFAENMPISTYIYAVAAGPYHVVTDSHDDIPLGILCRQSLAKHLDSEELFTLTKQGLEFYASFFGKYPYAKYDQAFVPEFNEGAMENVGLVTFTESYIYTDPPTQSQRLSRADTILHEMAHMWFGDLVTMKWWDGLWLNESFATYMAALCVAEATRFGATSWVQFNSGMKAWGMREDQLSTTHPINPESTPDTDAAFSSFDGVTYGKGASVLKQLVAVIGMDAFKAGMKTYFARHSWGNTTLDDFLAALADEAGDGFDMDAWATVWLKKAGLNTLRAEFDTDGAGPTTTITSFRIHQSAPEAHPTLRPHTLVVCGYNSSGEVLFEQQVTVQPVAVTEVEALAGRPAPDLALVHINHGDHAYAKTEMDPLSLEFARTSLQPATLPSPLSRRLLWADLYNMTRDARLSALDFLAIVRANVGKETDPELLSSIVRNASQALHNFVPDSMFVDQCKLMFDEALARLQAVPADDTDKQLEWARFMVGCAASPVEAERLTTMLASDEPVGAFRFTDQRLRWSILIKAAVHGVGDVDAALKAEEAKDPSDRGQRSLQCARTAVASADVKAAAWERFNAPDADKGSLHTISSAMNGFAPRAQRELVEPYTDKFFAAIVGVFKDRSKGYATSYWYSLCPSTNDAGDVLPRLQTLLASLGDGEDVSILVRLVKEQIDSVERVLKARRLILDGKSG